MCHTGSCPADLCTLEKKYVTRGCLENHFLPIWNLNLGTNCRERAKGILASHQIAMLGSTRLKSLPLNKEGRGKVLKRRDEISEALKARDEISQELETIVKSLEAAGRGRQIYQFFSLKVSFTGTKT